MKRTFMMKWQICVSISSLALSLCFFLTAHGQNKKTRRKASAASQCSLSLKDAPPIHGVKLGMTISEFLGVFPSATRSFDRNGVIRYEDQQNEPTISMADFLDGTLVTIHFDYRSSEPAKLDSFRRQTAARFGLPLAGWKSEYGTAELNCRGFRVTVMGGLTEKRLDFPYLLLDDLTRLDEWDRRN